MMRWAVVALATCLLGVAGCGREGSDPATSQPMTAEAPAEDAKGPEALVDVPRIERVRFEPDTPFAGRSARVVTDLSWNGRNVDLEYAFSAGGRELQADGDRVRLSTAKPGERLEVTVTPFVRGVAGIPRTHAIRLRATAPRIVDVTFSPNARISAGSSVKANPIVEDGDPTRMIHRYQWIVNGRRQSAYEAHFSTEGLKRGDELRVEIIAADGTETSERFLSDPITLVNALPEMIPGPLGTDEFGGLNARLQARDADGDRPIVFRLLDGPPGLTLSADGQLAWAGAGSHPGSHAVQIELDDGQGGKRTTRFSVDIGAPAAVAR